MYLIRERTQFYILYFQRSKYCTVHSLRKCNGNKKADTCAVLKNKITKKTQYHTEYIHHLTSKIKYK